VRTQTEIIQLVVEALDRLEIPYMLAGSLAAAVHGVARSTRDGDIVAALEGGDGARLADALGPNFYLDRETAERAIQSRSNFNAIYIPDPFKVDFFILGPGPYDQEAFRRRLVLPLDPSASREACWQTPEDVVISKLRWFRQGNEASEVQWRDVVGLLKLQGDALDSAYLCKWAEREGVLDLLERARREAAP
jgi:hypothetical protein